MTDSSLPPPAQTISYPAEPRSSSRYAQERVDPHVIVLFGATGDLARRKLLPGMAHLVLSDLAPDIRIVGTSLEEMDDAAFRAFACEAVEQFGLHELHPRAVGHLRRQPVLRPAVRRPGGAGRRGRPRGGGAR